MASCQAITNRYARLMHRMAVKESHSSRLLRRKDMPRFQKAPEISQDIHQWRIRLQELLADWGDICLLGNHLVQRPGEGLVAHDDRTQQGVLAHLEAQPADLDVGLDGDGIGKMAPGLAIAADDADHILIIASTDRADDG